MEPAALPAARMSRRPECGGSGKCGGKQLLGCAAATAALNKPSRNARLDPATIKTSCPLDRETLSTWRMIWPLIFGTAASQSGDRCGLLHNQAVSGTEPAAADRPVRIVQPRNVK